METILASHNLSKNYGRLQAVNNLNLQIEQQSVYGILGPNGSGKTTTLGMLLGIIHPSNGSFSWFNNGSEDSNRKRIGAILEQPIFYPYLSGEQNLKISAEIKEVNKTEVDRVLHLVNLYERKKSEAKTYSLGMKQRLAIASALLGDPEVLVLDEPTNGLDPQGIAEIRNLILSVAETGKTILLASHLLDEVEKVCTHVAVIKNGNLLAEGKVSQILNAEPQIELATNDHEKTILVLQGYTGINKIDNDKEMLVLSVNNTVLPSEINRHLLNNNIEVSHLALRRKKLEQQFLELTA